MYEKNLKTYRFDDGSQAYVEDKKVIYFDGGVKWVISGFTTNGNAHNFIMFGDFEKPVSLLDNDYIRITKSKETLVWEKSG